jgi:hypothetical protein
LQLQLTITNQINQQKINVVLLQRLFFVLSINLLQYFYKTRAGDSRTLML